MRRLILAAAFAAGSVAVVASAPSASACTNYTEATGAVYVTDDGGGVWLYIEDNGAGGLQRGGVSLLGEAGPLCGETGDSPDFLVL